MSQQRGGHARSHVADGRHWAHTPSPASEGTPSLLFQARTHWLFGEWQRLCQLEAERVAQDAERAAVALLISSAQQQAGDQGKARQWARQAMQWGMAPNMVARLLAAGVHNTLGRMAILREDNGGMSRHFTASLQLAALKDTDSGTLVRARASHEASALGRQLPGLKPPVLPQAPSPSSEDDGFYRAFEDRFRGSREEIKRRVAVYLPFVTAVAERHPGVPALDLGCGRGEWLEVMRDAGILAEGVDEDAGMLSGGQALGLKVSQGDALAHLRDQPDASLISISLIHVVEHIPFDMLRTTVAEAKRVLVPDGVLIMETPNPENFSVGSCSFYTDPTHRNPLPPPLLAFLPEYYGFERVKVLRLQENPALHDKPRYELHDFLTGISPDYAVVAQPRQRESNSAAGQEEQEAWSRNYGISLAQLRRADQRHSDDQGQRQ
ncbi:class I SAM-dependent methyltransferase [Aquibaculum arenosum]|uniref:Class I SAM-dependent methyltransferase n=1 Tax=Aquibaculum arenosum TaxID=3032591 RepID=A0ABT5YMG0_9PROT|nr:class I SAM-dependent methyltransferase [Fodinicurvata sp. CAU 1616]MDF2096151.1 class I SAM-dependent methyltransferase [Fodinicurvata sp. CAU 1616]